MGSVGGWIGGRSWTHLRMDNKLKSKAHRLVRMVFQDVYVNYHARNEVWTACPPSSVIVNGWKLNLGPSNAGTLQLVCAGVETFGRVLLGYSNDEGVSGESFSTFIELYFPSAYKNNGKKLFETFRCGLLHSHFLGYGSEKGFLPTRTGAMLSDRHLQYADLAAENATPTKDLKYFRLIVNIDTFTADFQKAVEEYLKEVENKSTRTARLYNKQKKKAEDVTLDIETNLKKALKDYPLETPALYELS